LVEKVENHNSANLEDAQIRDLTSSGPRILERENIRKWGDLHYNYLATRSTFPVPARRGPPGVRVPFVVALLLEPNDEVLSNADVRISFGVALREL
jgi:hypothetical protein